MKHATFTRFLSLALAIAVMMSWATPIGVYANDEPLTSEGAATEQPAPVEEEVIVPEDVPAASEPSVQEQPAATPAETALPEAEPTAEPVVDSSEKPEAAAPSATPEATEPTATVEPSAQPTALPEAVEPAATAQPTAQPTVMPQATEPAATVEPSAQPVATPEATEPAATAEPTAVPETAEPNATEEPFDVVAAYDYVMGLATEEEAIAYLDTLSEEDYAALQEYSLSQNENVEEKTAVSVPFLEAGPFLAPVFVPSTFNGGMRLMRKGTGTQADNEGIITSKTVLKDGDGYKLRLESYVTGNTTTSTETKSVPVDIVLVLDQSGSMAYDFHGKKTSNNSERRQYALKAAVKNFINDVAAKYSDKSDHRVSIVTFGNSAKELIGWTAVNKQGQGNLITKVSGLPDKPTGATNTAEGVALAEGLMGNGYNYNGPNQERQKVVIVFTDGAPTPGNQFSTDVANDAIAHAKNLKDSGTTVYTVGIFSGVNVDQLYGEGCGGWVGSSWPMDGGESAACNRFMNYLSSNFKGATGVGIKEDEVWNFPFYEYVWTITEDFPRTAKGYYLAATNQEELGKIFDEISNQIQSGSASVELGSETVVKDVVTPQFNIVDANRVKIYTSDYQKDGTWGADQEAGETQVSCTVNKEQGTVEVSGFDFSKNYCDNSHGRDENDTTKPGTFYGRKLIVEIYIEPKAGFFGGNNIATNGEGSAIYDKNGKKMEDFVSPNLNLSIQYDFVTKDQTVYLTNSAELSNAFAPASGFKADGINNAYVDVTYTVTDAANNEIGTYTIPRGATTGNWNGQPVTPNNCTAYKVSCVVTPAQGVPDSMKSDAITEKTLAAKEAVVHVLKPTITWHDSTQLYNTQITPDLLLAHQAGNVVWKDDQNHEGIPQATETEVPELSFSFTDENGNPLEGTPLTKETLVKVTVNATVTMGTSGTKVEDITENTTQNWQKDSGCTCVAGPDGAQFRIHVPMGSLVIVKHLSSFNSSMGKDANFTFKIEDTNGNIWYRHVKLSAAGNAVTESLDNLPAGTYTVTELSSLGYKAAGDVSQKKVEVTGEEARVEFTNDSVGGNIPGDQTIVKNHFTWDAAQGKWTYTA